jgi:hypothetical protein
MKRGYKIRPFTAGTKKQSFSSRLARPLEFCHGFRLQINSVNLVTLGCHNQHSIANVKLLDKNPLNVLLERWVNPIREDRQIPKLFVGLNIPSLNVCAPTIIIRSRVSNALMDYGLDLCRRDTLRERQTWQQQRHCDKSENVSRHERDEA